MKTTSNPLGSPPAGLSLIDLIDGMHSAKRLDPQSCLERPDLDRAVRMLGLPYPNWHQAWHGLVMASTPPLPIRLLRFMWGSMQGQSPVH